MLVNGRNKIASISQKRYHYASFFEMIELVRGRGDRIENKVFDVLYSNA